MRAWSAVHWAGFWKRKNGSDWLPLFTELTEKTAQGATQNIRSFVMLDLGEVTTDLLKV